VTHTGLPYFTHHINFYDNPSFREVVMFPSSGKVRKSINLPHRVHCRDLSSVSGGGGEGGAAFESLCVCNNSETTRDVIYKYVSL
jgi:hypothetical protein